MASPTPANGTMPDYSKMPAGPPPPGVIPNFHNPESRAPIPIAVCATMICLTVPCIAIRLFTRLKISKSAGWDDWVALVGAMFTVGFSGYSIALFKLPGNGPHIWNVPASVYLDPSSRYFLRMLFTQILYTISAAIIKLSLLLFYGRLFAMGFARYFIYGGAVALTTLYTLLLFLIVGYCARNPSLLDTKGSCYAKGGNVGWALTGVNIFSDFYILAIPLFILKNLKMSGKKKIAVGGIFLMGIFATVASILTLYFRIKATRGTDVSWEIVPAATCTILELNLGVICSCLPSFAALVKYRTGLTNKGSSYANRSSKRRIIDPNNTSSKASSNIAIKEQYNDSAKLVKPDQYLELGNRTDWSHDER